MAVFSVFSLCSCSLISTNKTLQNSGDALKVGETTLTKNDIINSFYTYYQNNSNYFSYYDEDTIIDSFYTWVAMRQIINENATKMLHNSETNPNGFIIYTNKDEEDVWKSVKDYFYSQVNTYEKAIYKFGGYEESAYPIWLRDDESESETNVNFKPYETTKPEIVSKEDKIKDETTKLDEASVKAKINEVKKYLFEYVVSTDEEGNDTREKITYDGYIDGSRNDAYTRYVEWLVSSAKSNGTSTDTNVVIENEIVRVYNSFYDSKLTSLFQDYYLKEYLTNYYGELEDSENVLSDKAIVKAFMDKYNADKQTNMVEKNFISTITSTDGATLVLYNYEGQNFFFTVQHILIKYDDYISKKITELDGYTSGSSSDLDYELSKAFKLARENLVKGYKMMAEVNKDNYAKQTTISDFVNKQVYPYYFDESKNNDNGVGYILLQTDVARKDNIFDYEDIEYYYNDADGKHVVSSVDVKWLSNQNEISKIYEDAYNSLVKEFISYFDALGTDEETVNTIREAYADMDYILKTIENIKETYGNSVDDIAKAKDLIRQKTASFVFVELEFIFSADSLGNDLKNKIGYVMSNYPDQNGSWVVDFAEGARAIIKNIVGENGDTKDIELINSNIKSALELNSSDKSNISKLTQTIISDYGYHIIKIEDIYTPSASLVDVDSIPGNKEFTDEFIENVISMLKKTYVCSASNQTLYDYFFDQLYTGFAGNPSSSNSSGTYFLKLEYEWLHEYYQAGKIVFEEKMSYDELYNSIQR